MAEENIDITIDVDTGRSTSDLDRLEDASRVAGGALDELDTKARNVDPTVAIDIDVDVDKAKRAGDELETIDRKSRGMADGVGFGNNALRDLTGPLGDTVGPAGDVGDAFEGLGDIVGGIGAKLGLGEEAVGKLTGAVAGVGVVVAAGIAAWSLYRNAQKKAEEQARKLYESNQKLADGKVEEAAAGLAEQYAGTLKALRELGYGSATLVDILRGQTSVVGDLDAKIDSLTAQYDAANLAAAEGSAAERDRAAAIRDQLDAVVNLQNNLASLETDWKAASDQIRTTEDVTGELVTALGGVKDEASSAAAAVVSIEDAFTDLTKALDDQTAIEDVRDAFDNVEDAAIEAWNSAAEGSPTAARAMRDYEQSVRDAVAQVLGLTTELDNIPAETVAAIAVKVNDGDLAGARSLLEDVAKDIPPVRIRIDTAFLAQQFRDWLRNSGPGSSNMNPAPAPGGRSGGPESANVTNYYPPRLSPTEQYRAQRTYTRVQG